MTEAANFIRSGSMAQSNWICVARLEPTLSALHQLIFAHSHAISYELLDIMLGRTPRLDLPALQHKMILAGAADIAWNRTCCSGKVFGHWATR